MNLKSKAIRIIKGGNKQAMKGIITAPQPRAAEEGAEVLRKGGNAFDAAIATAFVQMVVSPGMCGVGGWGLSVSYDAKTKESTYLSFLGQAGSKVTPTMWEKDVQGRAPVWGVYLIRGNPHIAGYTSIQIPGTVKGLYELWEKSSSLEWKELIQPAIRYAREGFQVTPLLAQGWRRPAIKESGLPSSRELYSTTEACRRIFFKENGDFREAGELLKNEDYARTLEKIADGGAKVLYEGELARIIADDFEKNGAFVTFDDLRNYKVRQGAPVCSSYRGYEIASSGPPNGGPTVIEILNILEGYDLKKLQLNSPEYLYVMAKAMQAAHVDRGQWVGDPDFSDVPLQRLISKERAAEWQAKINSGQEIKFFDGSQTKDATHTTHVSAADEQGNCISLTHTNAMCSGVVTPGLGFIYNDSMVFVDPFPGHPNSIAPGKSRTSGVSPTIVSKDGKPFYIVGAPGGVSIISAVAQSIVNVIDHRLSAQEASWVPRIHCEGEDVIVSARISTRVCDELRKKGLHVIHSVFGWGGHPFALPHGVMVDVAGMQFEGGADPGGEGGVAISS